MNEVLKAIKERRSIRKYKSDMLPKEIIDQVIESGCSKWKGATISYHYFSNK